MNDEELMKRVLANQIKEIISQLLESRKRDEVEEFKNQILARNERILKRISDEMSIESRYDPKEIKTWLDNQQDKDVRFVSLDDDFPKHKYDEAGIGDCLVRTSFYEKDGGLRQEHVEKAVRILNMENKS